MAPSAPPVSHLLFADDSLLFFKADRVSAEEMKDILQVYCEASGQQVNMDKSSIHFAKGCPGSLREEIKGILGVDNEDPLLVAFQQNKPQSQKPCILGVG